MKNRSFLFTKLCACVTALVLLTGMFPSAVLADSYTATTMRLLHYEGKVEIEDSSGKQRPVMENVRLNSGEAMKTGESSTASVGLDQGRVVTLDALSRVEFEKKAGALSMNLTEGHLFLDVSEKLDANETMDIKTSTMVVGIRGTIIYVSNEPVTDEAAADLRSVDLEGLAPEKGSIVRLSQLGVLEGTAQITYTDNAGRKVSGRGDGKSEGTSAGKAPVRLVHAAGIVGLSGTLPVSERQQDSGCYKQLGHYRIRKRKRNDKTANALNHIRTYDGGAGTKSDPVHRLSF